MKFNKINQYLNFRLLFMIDDHYKNQKESHSEIFESYSSIKSLNYFSSYFNNNNNNNNSDNVSSGLVNDGLDNIREFLLLYYDKRYFSESYCKLLVLKQLISSNLNSNSAELQNYLPVLSSVLLKVSSSLDDNKDIASGTGVSSSDLSIALRLPPLSVPDFINISFPSPKSRFRILTSSSSSSSSSSLDTIPVLEKLHSNLSLVDEYLFRETISEMILSFSGLYLFYFSFFFFFPIFFF
jgi:hypothetical protein